MFSYIWSAYILPQFIATFIPDSCINYHFVSLSSHTLVNHIDTAIIRSPHCPELLGQAEHMSGFNDQPIWMSKWLWCEVVGPRADELFSWEQYPHHPIHTVQIIESQINECVCVCVGGGLLP